jgi:DNA-directed RNA polymerase subunit RPC12/RpoP
MLVRDGFFMGFSEFLGGLFGSKKKAAAPVKCPNCSQYPLDATTDRCPKCGVRVYSMMRIKCPQCGMLNQLDASSCWKCKFNLASLDDKSRKYIYRCHICGTEKDKFFAVCPTCGTRMV